MRREGESEEGGREKVRRERRRMRSEGQGREGGEKAGIGRRDMK